MHPNSLANLQKGSNSTKSFKKDLTKKVSEDIVTLIAEDADRFREQLLLLSPKDYCNTYIQMLKIITPKQVDLEVNEDLKHIDWTIQLVDSPVRKKLE